MGKTVAEAQIRLLKIGAIIEGQAKMLAGKGGGKVANPSPDPKVRSANHVYYYEALSRWVQGSAPGKPPHAQTSSLYQSISHRLLVTKLGVVVGPSVLYGKWLEFGTKTMAARPFMRPALFAVVSRMTKIFERMF